MGRCRGGVGALAVFLLTLGVVAVFAILMFHVFFSSAELTEWGWGNLTHSSLPSEYYRYKQAAANVLLAFPWLFIVFIALAAVVKAMRESLAGSY